MPYIRIGDVAVFSKETTDFSEFTGDTFQYLEISGVSLEKNTYSIALIPIKNAPSRARMKTKVGDIAISTTRPHRGAIVQIIDQGIIASTGFSIIREIDSRINREWFLFLLRSNIILQQMLQRSSGGNYPAIIEDEIKKICFPLVDKKKQLDMVKTLNMNYSIFRKSCATADVILVQAKEKVFTSIGITFGDYKPSIFSFQRLQGISNGGIYCNARSAYLNGLFENLRRNKWYAGHLDEFVDINPRTDRSMLAEDTPVTFVPMTAVEEKTNHVEYESRKYGEVRTGFTIFQRGDLLWAKITPCMQNGKSFFASDMPTNIGFASTEFHVLRKKSNRIYMPYLWVILSENHILEAAQGMFSGSAGQQRVPDAFLRKFPIVLPPIEVQKELADNVFDALQRAKEMRAEAEREWLTAKAEFEKELLGG